MEREARDPPSRTEKADIASLHPPYVSAAISALCVLSLRPVSS
jgi:hypothetical protein